MHLNPDIAQRLQQLNNPSLPGIDLSLERMVKLLAALGDPHLRLPPVIHVAGTNGKGSTIAYLKAIYTAAGYRVHAYTSPHLVRFNERIVLAGEEITDAALLPVLNNIIQAAKDIPVTFFEATTAAAFVAFAEHAADIVLLETGLGGRLDATNMVPNPLMTIITPIDFDHMEFLGTSLPQIAAEKAGIIKPNTPCVVGMQLPDALEIIRAKTVELAASCIACSHEWSYAVTPENIEITQANQQWSIPFPALLGQHQYHNAALASVAVHNCASLPVTEQAMNAGIVAAEWPARLQRLTHGPLVEIWGDRGPVILDGAHNVSASHALASWLKAAEQPVTMIIGMMRRKDPVAFLRPLAPYIRMLIATEITGEDCHPPEIVAEAARSLGISCQTGLPDMSEYKTQLSTEEAGVLLVTGSLFLAGAILKNHG